MKVQTSFLFLKAAILCLGLLNPWVAIARVGSSTLDPSHFQDGDLILVSLNCFQCKLIQDTTHSQYSHVAIMLKDSLTGKMGAVMAVPPAVMELKDLSYFYDNSLIEPLVLRMKTLEGQMLSARAALIAKRYLGTPYDHDFVNAPKKLYCADLIALSFKDAAEEGGVGREPFPLKPMDFTGYMDEWAKVLGHPAPQGFPGISPADFERSPLLDILTSND